MYHTVYVEWDERTQMTSRPKGIGDIYSVVDKLGGKTIEIPSFRRSVDIGFAERLKMQRKIYNAWMSACARIERGEWLLVEIPIYERFIYFKKVIKKLKRRGVKIAVFAVDLQAMTNVKYRKGAKLKADLVRRDEQFIIDNADMIITHNDEYEAKLRELGAKCEIHKFEIFDYLAPEFDASKSASKKFDRSGPVIIATNLNPLKAGYVDKLPDNYRFNLYGNNYAGTPTDKVQYKGAFPPEELMEIMEGSFGLVWDGDSSETCSGNYGEYLKYNIPHKMSLYLASGIPVIIWKDAAMASYVNEHKCGFTVESLSDIAEIVESMSDNEYEQLSCNAAAIGERLREGYYTKRVMHEAFGL